MVIRKQQPGKGKPEKHPPRRASWERRVLMALTTVATVAFGSGTFSFQGMTNELHALRDEARATHEELTKITTRLTVLESADIAARLRELEKAANEAQPRLQAVEKRLDMEEKKK